jgi:hypothetical protein
VGAADVEGVCGLLATPLSRCLAAEKMIDSELEETMSFDPEKVERCSFDDHEELHVVDNGDWVLASDYDQLLQLYRKLRSYCDTRDDLPQGLWSDARYRAESGRQQAAIEMRRQST